MAQGGNKAGEFFIEGKVGKEGVQRGMDETKKIVEEGAAAAGDAVEKNIGKGVDAAAAKAGAAAKKIGADAERSIGGGFEAAGQKIDGMSSRLGKASNAVISLVGKVTGLVAVFTLALGALAKINAAWEEQIRLARETRVATKTLRLETDLQLGALQGMTTEQQLELDLRIKSAAAAAEIRNLIKEGKLEAAEAYNINLDIQAVLLLQNKERAKQIEAQREAADEAERLADAMERAKVGGEQLLRIQKEMAGVFIPEILGPFIKDFTDAIAKLDESITNAAEAQARVTGMAGAGQTFTQSGNGSIETLGDRFVESVDSLRLGGDR